MSHKRSAAHCRLITLQPANNLSVLGVIVGTVVLARNCPIRGSDHVLPTLWNRRRSTQHEISPTVLPTAATR